MNYVQAVGFHPAAGIPREDYLDFIGGTYNLDEIKAGLSLGVYPPGLIIANLDGSQPAVVLGDYDTRQALVAYCQNVPIG